MSKNLIVIVGPTGIGKTSTSILLAKHYNCEIISADSRQFYCELTIGTAKPSNEEMDGVPHHFVGNLPIVTEYTSGKFEHDALKKIEALHKNQDYVIMVGGSGLYIDAVCNGLDNIPGSSEIRAEIVLEFEKSGIEYLRTELKKIDPEYFHIVDKGNPQRMIRGIEVFRTSGKPYSSFRKRETQKRNFNILKIGLAMDREQLYDRINKRVDLMLDAGLEDEVHRLMPHKDKTALKTVGYLELFRYFDGEISKEEAIELIKRNSRRYAKRQITWFKRDETIFWTNPNDTTNMINHLDNRLNTAT